MVETGGADVARRPEASGCGCDAIERAEVEVVVVIGGVVVIIGGIDTTIGGMVVIIGGADTTIDEGVLRMVEAIVVTEAETGLDRHGGDGAIGSTGCAPLPPMISWSAVVEAEAFLVVS